MSVTHSNEYTETRLQELRSRILGRLRKPCVGRFDPVWDVEQEFIDDCRNANRIANALISQTEIEVDKFYFAAILDELEWAEQSVRNAWKSQDNAIEKSRNSSPPEPKVHPNQTTLM